MNKGELVTSISEKVDCTKIVAEKFLNSVMEAVLESLQKGNDVNLIGFGTFYVKDRKERVGRNPKTGEKMMLKAYRQPSFRAGKRMKELCNEQN
ncbi:MAG: HU family DNA-binding protein [Rickettsia sp.]|nr:HU family DNA-binding protein [Rickettsia sp.]